MEPQQLEAYQYCASEAKPLDRGGYPRTLKEMLIELTYQLCTGALIQ